LPRVLNLLRAGLHYRRQCFDQGLQAAGFKLVSTLTDPRPGDLLVIWNRYGGYHEHAQIFERAGASVLVVENGLLSKTWRGGEWFSLSLGHCGGAGEFKPAGPERLDSWGVPMAPWREGGRETVILGQRGIGEPGVASPTNWAEGVQRRIGGRIRQHPGKGEGKPLADDLVNAREVITWHSAAALQALMLGVPVWYDCPTWIGAGAARPLSQWPGQPKADDAARLEMFRRLAWCNWTLDEIKTGAPIARLR
jgi:hypothetical protein